MDCLDIDFETLSDEDLKTAGLARYASHPSTDVICMAWSIDFMEPELWWSDEPMPERLRHALESDIPIYAHNADFERHIFDFVMANVYGVDVKLERWRCTMVTALAHGLPASLGELAIALDLPVQKQKHGARLIREYCGPNRISEWKDGDKELMSEYCRYDVKVQQAARRKMRELSDYEWAEYHLNCRINDRGLPIDAELAEKCLNYADAIAAEAADKITALTDGMMTSHTKRKGRDLWLLPRLTDDQKKLLEVYKDGKKKISLDEDHRNALLEAEGLDPKARNLLELINDAGSAALKKYGAAANQHLEGRVHNTFLFHGAQTGRYSGRGIQPHNFRRDAYGANEAGALIADIKEGYEIEAPTNTMARLLRSMIYDPAGVYYVDWSAIEGRVAPWLANSKSAEKKLDLYRQNKDVYVDTASGMFKRDYDEVMALLDTEDKEAKSLRQRGKIAELSLQFGGGSSALQGMAANYGLAISDDEADDLVRRWRKVNPWAVNLWPQYEEAASNAVQKTGEVFKAQRVFFYSDGRYLWCRLPSGRLLAYPKPRMETYETPWGAHKYGATFQTSTRVKVDERKKKGDYYRNALRGSLLMQNATQAVAADILRETLVEADKEGLDIRGSVHDEVIGVGPHKDGKLLNEIMLENPSWAEGLPLATGGVEYGTRYGK